MSEFLDQAEIDRLQFALSEVTAKKEKAVSAIQKVKQMYFTVVKQYCESELETIDETGKVISEIGNQLVVVVVL